MQGGAESFNFQQVRFVAAALKLTSAYAHACTCLGLAGVDTYQGPPALMADREKLDVAVDPNSNRLQLLTPFKPWNGEDIKDCAVLIKVRHPLAQEGSPSSSAVQAQEAALLFVV